MKVVSLLMTVQSCHLHLSWVLVCVESYQLENIDVFYHQPLTGRSKFKFIISLYLLAYLWGTMHLFIPRYLMASKKQPLRRKLRGTAVNSDFHRFLQARDHFINDLLTLSNPPCPVPVPQGGWDKIT